MDTLRRTKANVVIDSVTSFKAIATATARRDAFAKGGIDGRMTYRGS